jgi:hypothetical protein
MTAIGVMHAILGAGLRIPNDFSVASMTSTSLNLRFHHSLRFACPARTWRTAQSTRFVRK